MKHGVLRRTKLEVLAAVVLTTLLSVVSAGASSPSTVTFTGTAPTSLVANTASTWTIGFTTSASGALGPGGSISVSFPSGFTTVSTAPVITLKTPSSFVSSCTAAGVDVTQTNVVTINLGNKTGTCALAANTTATLSIAVVNGPSGTYGGGNFSVATSADSTAATPSVGVTVTGTAVSSFSVSTTAPTSLVKAAASTWTLGFTTSSVGSLSAGSTMKLTFPPTFTTASTAPTVTLKSPSTFVSNCVATASDPTSANVITVTLTNNGANTCALAASTAATLGVAVVNGTNDTLTSFSIATSKDTNLVTPTTGSAPVLTGATTVSSVSFTSTAPTSLVANTPATWTVNLTTSSSGGLASGGYIVATLPPGFTTTSSTPTVTLLTPSTFPTSCVATASDPTSANVITVTLTNNGANTCALAASVGASFSVAVVNGPASVDAATSFSVLTSKDGTAASPAVGATITGAGAPGTGTNWSLASSSPTGQSSADPPPTAPVSFQGGATGGYMCVSTSSETVSLSWSPVVRATSYAILQSSTPNGTYLTATPAPVYSGTTATITYTTAVTEYFKVEALVGTSWVSALSSNAVNGSVSPGYVVTATASPYCTNN